MYRDSKIIILTLGLILISACNSTQNSKANEEGASGQMRIELIDIQSESKKVLSDATNLQVWNELLAVKKQVILKKKPVFDHQLAIVDNKKTKVWLISSHGYVAKKDDKTGNVYQVDRQKIQAFLTEGS